MWLIWLVKVEKARNTPENGEIKGKQGNRGNLRKSTGTAKINGNYGNLKNLRKSWKQKKGEYGKITRGSPLKTVSEYIKSS